MLSSGLPPALLLLTALELSWSLSDEEKMIILDGHNKYRAQVSPPAMDMLKMSWDTELEAFAQAYAEKCIWDHNKERGRRGENLFAMAPTLDLEFAVEDWNGEEKYYNLTTSTCVPGQMCGHYTQVVWANTHQIGCGAKFCEKIDGIETEGMYLLVCNYYPPGNMKGRKPYKEGPSCSQCPEGRVCVNSLCEPTVEETTPASVTTKASPSSPATAKPEPSTPPEPKTPAPTTAKPRLPTTTKPPATTTLPATAKPKPTAILPTTTKPKPITMLPTAAKPAPTTTLPSITTAKPPPTPTFPTTAKPKPSTLAPVTTTAKTKPVTMLPTRTPTKPRPTIPAASTTTAKPKPTMLATKPKINTTTTTKPTPSTPKPTTATTTTKPTPTTAKPITTAKPAPTTTKLPTTTTPKPTTTTTTAKPAPTTSKPITTTTTSKPPPTTPKPTTTAKPTPATTTPAKPKVTTTTPAPATTTQPEPTEAERTNPTEATGLNLSFEPMLDLDYKISAEAEVDTGEPVSPLTTQDPALLESMGTAFRPKSAPETNKSDKEDEKEKSASSSPPPSLSQIVPDIKLVFNKAEPITPSKSGVFSPEEPTFLRLTSSAKEKKGQSPAFQNSLSGALDAEELETNSDQTSVDQPTAGAPGTCLGLSLFLLPSIILVGFLL
ncbi:peptidase inhibitor 16 isoform X2 [Phaenicophaeus curvirostris]|uniref:peptidase inhibitor 16 isoform X2 n=1 Tax=Phaenicophaeus curvirostris TaxID=33595 RepID=UPI0037F0B51F